MALTPNGRADAVTQLPEGGAECFVLPALRRMRVAEFLTLLASTREQAGAGTLVAYMHAQNDSLRQELPGLLQNGDVDAELPWANEAFGGPPEVRAKL